ncbi:MAG TPA: VCBS repeat-containing protein [Polyangiaceae bacterium]
MFASGLEGCVFGNAECTYDREECVGTSGAYRVCHGGEGHYSWATSQCPGVQPVCSLSQSGHVGCEDLATPEACSQISPLLAAGAAKLSSVLDLKRDGSVNLVFGGDLVARSNEQGQFDPARSLGLRTAGRLQQLLPAELNGDGIADLAVTSDDPRELYAFFGDTDGSYAFAQRYFVTSVPRLAAGTDFDGDGRDELIGTVDQQGIHVLSGVGDSELSDRLLVTAARYADIGPDVHGAFVADFDGRAPLDLAASGSNLDIYLAQPDGSYQRAASIADGLAIGDLDADGRADVAGRTTVGHDGTAIMVHFSGSDAAFKQALTLPVPYLPADVFIADFDGDGLNDVAAQLLRTPQALLQVFLGNGDGSFRAAELVSLPFDTSTRLFLADVEHDGRADLIGQLDGNVLELSGACVAAKALP